MQHFNTFLKLRPPPTQIIVDVRHDLSSLELGQRMRAPSPFASVPNVPRTFFVNFIYDPGIEMYGIGVSRAEISIFGFGKSFSAYEFKRVVESWVDSRRIQGHIF